MPLMRKPVVVLFIIQEVNALHLEKRKRSANSRSITLTPQGIINCFNKLTTIKKKVEVNNSLKISALKIVTRNTEAVISKNR